MFLRSNNIIFEINKSFRMICAMIQRFYLNNLNKSIILHLLSLLPAFRCLNGWNFKKDKLYASSTKTKIIQQNEI